jgi:Na+-transporting NADH:ubiquinone oxidoreductase subunit NqrB
MKNGAPLPEERPAAPPAPAPRGRFQFDKRFIAPIFITCILIVGELAGGVLESNPFLAQFLPRPFDSPTFVAIITALLAELILGRSMYSKWPHLASAYVSGISVGILLRSPNHLWPYIVGSLLSIVSKYVLQVGNRHLWNPSNFGMSVLLFVAPAYATVLSIQWSNEIWPVLIIWPLGLLILLQVHRLHITLTYVASFLLLSLVRCAITGDPWAAEVAPITGPMYQLYIFFMITDPRTTTRTKWSQCLVIVLVAILEAALRLNQDVPFIPFVEGDLRLNLAVNAPFYALFVVGPIANLIEIAVDARKKARAGQVAKS